MWRDGGIVLLLASACFVVASADEINREKKVLNITVPRWVQNNTDQIMLDCAYEYRLNEDKFVVKWYLNDDPYAVYQWIPHENLRMFSPLFQRHVDWEYILEDSDKFTKYRRIILKHPTIEFRGTYQCTVNSKEGHGVAEAKMDIFAPAENITLTYNNMKDNQVNVTCIVKKIFPKPDVRLFAVSSDNDEPKLIEGTSTNIKDNGIHGYDITVNVVILTTDLNSSADTTFQCVVLIHENVYKGVKEVKYHPLREIAIIEPQVEAKNENLATTPKVSLASLIYIIVSFLML